MRGLEKIKSTIISIRDLPTIPEIVREAILFMSDIDVSMDKLVDIISKDPPLAGKLLRVVNSAFYGLSGKVGSLKFALVLLGMRQIRQLIFGISVLSLFPLEPGKPTFDRRRFWQHSAAVGMISRLLAIKAYHFIFEGSEFTAGLLHDIGKIVLDEYFHSEFIEALDISEKEQIPLYEAEMKVFGCTHAQIGQWVAERWNLPENIIETIALHHSPEMAKKEPFLVSIVHLANIFAQLKEVGFSGDIKPVCIYDDIGWNILSKSYPEFNDIDIVRFTHEIDREIEWAKEFWQVVYG
jgi:putative nucleotidyltransferase with HDIG domain